MRISSHFFRRELDIFMSVLLRVSLDSADSRFLNTNHWYLYGHYNNIL